MAKKIVIDFLDQPNTTGPGFSYTVSVDGYDLYYTIGISECKVAFLPIGGTVTTYYEMIVGATLEETIQLTYDFLVDNYINGYISYSIVGNTIEVLINADADVSVSGLLNTQIEIDVTEVEPSTINLIYYLIWDDYILNIYKENYLGFSTEIFGSFTLKKSPVDTILEPIRGTGLNLSLESNSVVNFDEFLLSDEFTYKTELLKNNGVIFKGYIKPDGVQQSYVNDEWLINVESVDGLGLLKDLSFVQEKGTHFTGKLSMYEIIKGCLERTHLEMDINTSIGLEYTGYAGDNILKDVFLDTARFVKDSNDPVLMNCNEVLTSVLNLFSGVITQQDGQWYICRPNDLVLNGYTTFINQTTNTVFTKNLNAVLGSQINNFYPHHCDSNQQIEVKGAISAYRLNYQYGFLEGLVANPNLNHDNDLLFDNWTIDDGDSLINDPLDLSGARMESEEASFPLSLTDVLTSDGVAGLQGEQYTFVTKIQSTWLRHSFYFKIKTSDEYYLNTANDWEVGEDSNTYRVLRLGKNLNTSTFYLTHELKLPPLPNDSDIIIVICRPLSDIDPLFGVGIGEVAYAQILDPVQTNGIVGEFHTVSRSLPPSSITKENQTVFNGDGTEVLIGSIYKADLTTVTQTWNRVGKDETLPILAISAMDDLRIQSSPAKIFSGSIFGEIPYLSVITIDNIVGLFMPIEYDFDYKSNKSNVKLMQFYNSDLGDISHEVSPDYGNSNIRPTIRG